MIDPRALARRLDEVRRRYADAGIEVMGLAEHAALLLDLAAFGDCIDAAQRVGGMPGGTTITYRIPEATEELQAIVSGTAEATDAILVDLRATGLRGRRPARRLQGASPARHRPDLRGL